MIFLCICLLKLPPPKQLKKIVALNAELFWLVAPCVLVAFRILKAY